MDKLRAGIFGNDGEPDNDSESGILRDISDASTLSWSTRIKGFLITFGLGLIFSILGTVMVFLGSFTAFALMFTFGNILSLSSTCFLMGPLNQIKKMFAKTRVIATIVVFITFVLTMCAGLWWKNGALALVFCLLQYVAMIWYSISYIPFARDAVMKCFGSIIG